VPVVAAGRTVKEFDSVNVDDIKSGMIAGQHFINRGFETIGYIQSGDQFNLPEKNRLKGLKKALSKHKRNLSVVYTVGNNRIEGGEKAGKMWSSEKKHPEAVFCSNDMLAMGFIQYLVISGVQIPDDVAVLGHDDVLFADRFIVPLSTVAFPKYEMGHHAINLLLDRISHPEYSHEPQTISLEPELVLRKSCI
jgi:LacI family transcriptional regulator